MSQAGWSQEPLDPAHDNLKVDAKYNSSDADLLVCAWPRGAFKSGWDQDPPPSATVARETIGFKVHKDQLSRMSAVFADMLELAQEALDGERNGYLPRVDLIEDAEVVRCLLGAVYHTDKAKVVPLDPPAHKWSFVKSVWEAAAKYELGLLKIYAESVISATFPALSMQDNIELLHKADILKAPDLAQKARTQLAALPLHAIPTDGLILIGAANIAAIAQERESKISKEVQTIKSSFNGASSSWSDSDFRWGSGPRTSSDPVQLVQKAVQSLAVMTSGNLQAHS